MAYGSPGSSLAEERSISIEDSMTLRSNRAVSSGVNADGDV